jgi:hypothetical protein
MEVGKMNSYIKPPSLSTSFSESGKRAKKRFDNILNTKTKKTGVFAFALVLMLIGVIGTMVACESQTKKVLLEHTSLQQLMGQKKEAVIDELRINESNAKVEKQNNEEQYSFETTIENNLCVVNVIFYNEIMMGYQYQFKDAKTAYDYAKKVRKNLELEYGEPTTYPVQSTTRAGFDSLKSYSDITTTDVGMIYYEDWTPEKDADLEKEMLGDIDIDRLDVRMQLSCLPNDNAFVIVRYSAIRKSLR